MNIRFEMFHALGKPWESLFKEAAEYANRIGRERLISISHSSDQQDAVVCVWYWAEEQAAGQAAAEATPATPAPPSAGELEQVKQTNPRARKKK